MDVKPLDIYAIEGRCNNIKSAIEFMISFSDYPISEEKKGITTSNEIIQLAAELYDYSINID